MNLFEYIRESLGALVQNKMRSVLSLLGIIIGISSVVILTAIGDGMKADMIKQFSSTQNLFTISRGSATVMFRSPWGSRAEDAKADPVQVAATEHIFTEEMIARIGEVFGDKLKAVVPAYQWNMQGASMYRWEEIYPNIRVVDDAFFVARNLSPERGIFWTAAQKEHQENTVVVGASTVSQIFKNEDPVGKTIILSGQAFTVIGVLPKTGDWNLDPAILVHNSLAKKRFGITKIDSIDVYVSDIQEMPMVQKNVGYFLMRSVGAESPSGLQFSLRSNEQYLKEMNKMIGQLALFVTGIASISLLVGGIGIMNIMLVSVTERTREIGIRKAIGARKRDIIMQFLTESSILSLIGGIGAIIFSYAVTKIIHMFIAQMNPILSLQTIVLATLFSVGIGIIFGLMPAWKAARMDAIEALRFE